MSRTVKKFKDGFWHVDSRQDFVEYTKELKQILVSDNADSLTDRFHRCVINLRRQDAPSPREEIVDEFYEALVAANTKHSFIRKLWIDSEFPTDLIARIITDSRSGFREFDVETEQLVSQEDCNLLATAIQNKSCPLKVLTLKSKQHSNCAEVVLNAAFGGDLETFHWAPQSYSYAFKITTHASLCWQILSTNTSLKHLRLGSLSDRDWVALAESLTINTSLESLEFDINHDRGTKNAKASLERIIRRNQTITKLIAPYEMLGQLTTAINTNPTLTFVYYLFYSYVDRNRHPWEPELQVNRKVEEFLSGKIFDPESKTQRYLLRKKTFPLSAYPHLLARVAHKPQLVSKILAQKTLLDQLLASPQQEVATNEPSQKKAKLF